jgi:hypothetical protein
MHTTAMYLPDTLSDVEQKSFYDLVHFSLLYPGVVSNTSVHVNVKETAHVRPVFETGDWRPNQRQTSRDRSIT